MGRSLDKYLLVVLQFSATRVHLAGRGEGGTSKTSIVLDFNYVSVGFHGFQVCTNCAQCIIFDCSAEGKENYW